MSVLKVAVLDDYQGVSKTSFDALDRASFEVTIFRDTLRPYSHPDTNDAERDALVERLLPFEIICTMRERTPFPPPLLARLPNLKLLLTTGRRNASLSLPTLASLSVPVAGTTDAPASPDSTTQHCVALILALARDIPSSHANLQRPGGAIWQTSVATPLSERTFSTIGLGRLGVAVAKIMRTAFNMRILAWSQNLTQEDADAKAVAAGLPVERPDGGKTFQVVSKEEAFAAADVLSLHLVLSDRSRGIVAAADLAHMKNTAFLVNTSRGPLVDEADLLAALKAGRIAGAALDVFDLEPLAADSEWRTTEWGVDGRSRVVLTPHMGYVEGEKLRGWYEQQVENIRRWKAGEELLNRFA
ncbi:related to formate dehydrogenase [Cephalotrichum gorgonifer]|uniref:Related to formate dehydrogenase n=1 Tax=Cephalotrichum gorgonifer TaxID=2041049 RepID=A0AAE8MY03_9PEZI|nr:related to formate dehydrogenase [Cephalotrichum gorgonifer]